MLEDFLHVNSTQSTGCLIQLEYLSCEDLCILPARTSSSITTHPSSALSSLSVIRGGYIRCFPPKRIFQIPQLSFERI